MKKILKLEIECGEKTCASSKGKFCNFFRYHPVSGNGYCPLFGSLQEKKGWVQRHEKCIECNKE